MPNSFQLSFTIEGEKQLSKMLLGLKETVTDWRPAFEKTARFMKDTFSDDVFSSNGQVIGEAWKPLSPAYLRAKKKEGYPTDILVRTGKMQRSFKTTFDNQSAVIENTAPYFKYHQSNKPRKVLPRRAMMKLADQQKKTIIDIFQKHYINGIKNI